MITRLSQVRRDPALERDARLAIGDGQMPDRFFVSVGPDYYTGDKFRCSRQSYSSGSRVVAVYDDLNDAIDKASEVQVSAEGGDFIGSVIIEDRIWGECYIRGARVNAGEPDTEQVYDDIPALKAELKRRGYDLMDLGDELKASLESKIPDASDIAALLG